MAQTSSLIIQNLSFSFPNSNEPFFYNLHASFQPNALNFIRGKNGVGKSTLLRVLHGDVTSDEYVDGILQIDGNAHDFKEAPEINKLVAMVTQNFNTMLVDTYTFTENLQCALMHQFPNLQTLPQPRPIPSFIEKYGINYNIILSSLSGGQRQILSIIMILQKAPKILLLDEPTAALDEDNARLIMDFLAELCIREQITIILIVHNKDIIHTYCTRNYFELTKNKNEKRSLISVEKHSYP